LHVTHFKAVCVIYIFIAQHNTELDFFLLNLRVPITKLANDSKQQLNFTRKYAT